MSDRENRTEAVPVTLPNGTVIKVEVNRTGREDVAFDILPFKQVTDAIQGIAEAISDTVEKLKPTKTSVKFGMEINIESGQLTALLVKGSGKSNLEISMEWGK